MYLLKFLIALFFVLGSSVLFFSIGEKHHQKNQNSSANKINDTTGKISLHIMKDNYHALNNTNIRLRFLKNGKLMVSETDELGYVEFDNIPNGVYEWGIETKDSSQICQKTKITLNPDEVVNKIIYLDREF